jgi:hypothetical protein
MKDLIAFGEGQERLPGKQRRSSSSTNLECRAGEKIKMWHQGLGHVGGEPTGRARCVSIGGASLSLSLSLSLCSRFRSAGNGSGTHLLAGSDHALGRGFSRVRSRPLIVAPLACARVNSLGCPAYNPWGTSEVALSRAYFPRAGVGPGAAVLALNSGSRRSLLFVALGLLGFVRASLVSPQRGCGARRGPVAYSYARRYGVPWPFRSLGHGAPPFVCYLGEAGPELPSGQVSPGRKERLGPARVLRAFAYQSRGVCPLRSPGGDIDHVPTSS